MNTHIARWKKQYDAVQKVIDALPESRDHTDEKQAEDKRSKTVSDNLSQEDEENIDEENLWRGQGSMNLDDHTMIPDRKVTEGNKAVATKPLPESEPK